MEFEHKIEKVKAPPDIDEDLPMLRILGKRSLSQITTFDFVMLLIIGEVTQQALLGQDYSITNALVLIIVLIAWTFCCPE